MLKSETDLLLTISFHFSMLKSETEIEDTTATDYNRYTETHPSLYREVSYFLSYDLMNISYANSLSCKLND